MARTDDVRARARLSGMLRAGRAQRIRREAGVTQPQLAKALGVADRSIWLWERGDRFPRDTEVIYRYLALLDELVQLMSPEEEEPETASVGTRGP